MRILGGLVLPYYGNAALAAAAGLITGLLGWSTAFLIRLVLDRTGEPTLIGQVATVVAFAALFRSVTSILRRWLQLGLVRRIESDKARKYVDHVLMLDMLHLDRYPPADLLQRLQGLEHLRHALEERVLGVAFDVFLVLAAAIMLTRDSISLAGLALVGAILPAVTVFFVRESIKRSFEETQRRNASLAGQAMDTWCGVRDFRVLGGIETAKERLCKCHSKVQEGRIRHLLKLSVIGNVTSLLSGLVGLVILMVGVQEVRAGFLSPGQLMFASTMAGAMLGPLENFVVSWIFFNDAVVALRRSEEILVLPADSENLPGKKVEFRGTIRLSGVTFGYLPGKPVLRGIDLEISKGAVVAIVGESGSGKTTLLAMLAGLYKPCAGSITVDGMGLAEVARTLWEGQLGAVFHNPRFLAGTIDDNIRLGCAKVSTEKVIEVARQAGLEPFLALLPQGYSTPMTADGTPFSAGQVQRIALARALMRDPRILLLEEATSNLDVETESAIWSALAKDAARRTTVFVTHRLALSAKADQIVVLEKESIVEEGNFSDLMERKGWYWKLWGRQVLGRHGPPVELGEAARKSPATS